MLASLRDLSAGQPSVTRPLSPGERFEAIVAEALQGQPVLTYSTRLALLASAHRLGVGRFDANLIIASVQNRLGVRAETAVGRSSRWWIATATFVAVQSAILGGYWWLAHP